MRAVVYERYGSPDVLHLQEVEKPTPGPGEVLVEVKAAGLATGDRHLMRGEPFLVRLMFGLRRPKLRILGSAIAGRVEAVGDDVEALRVGDEVFGDLSDSGFGGFAEYAVAPESALAPKPEGTSFEDAAVVPGSALAALQGLRDQGRIREGRSVLVNGASGGVGAFAVQIAKSYGADVTAVCSTRNIDMVRGLGADRVIDYTKEDFRTAVGRYDVVLDAAAHRPVWASLRAVAKGGTYVFVGGGTGPTLQAMLLGPLLSLLSGKRVAFFIATPRKPDLLALKELVEKRELVPVIHRRYTLPELPDAVRHLESGQSRGKIVITMEE